MIHGTQYQRNWICVTINHTVILLIIEMEHLLHTIKNENQIHNSKILSHSTLKPGGDSALFKVLLGMQTPSARLNISNIIEHSQIDIRNRGDKFRAAGGKLFHF